MGFAAAGLPSKLVVAAPPAPIYVTGVRASSCACFSMPLALRRNYDSRRIAGAVRCDGSAGRELRTCRICKAQFDSALNHPTACRFHTSHFGGETKRKFESAYAGGTMDTPDSGKVFQYWHCCGSEDPFDPGCTASSHFSYDQ